MGLLEFLKVYLEFQDVGTVKLNITGVYMTQEVLFYLGEGLLGARVYLEKLIDGPIGMNVGNYKSFIRIVLDALELWQLEVNNCAND